MNLCAHDLFRNKTALGIGISGPFNPAFWPKLKKIMACSISLNPLVGQEANLGQGISSLTVSGQATDCSEVMVFVSNDDTSTQTPQKTVDVINGLWSVEFSVANNDFSLGDFICEARHKILVFVECADDGDCKEDFPIDSIRCNEGGCPDVSFDITVSDCENGLLSVHIEAQISNSPDATYTWFFGADDDNQPGEDSQAGGWLPNPDANGVRSVEVDHVYTAPDQVSDAVIGIEISSGPNSICLSQQPFELKTCACDVDLVLVVLDGAGNQVDVIDPCLSPGDYTVKIEQPSSGLDNINWSVDGESDSSETGSEYPLSIVAGDSKSISVAVQAGECLGSGSVTLAGCADCRDFSVDLKIENQNGDDVTDLDCLPPGDYSVIVSSPTGSGIDYSWSSGGVNQNTNAANFDFSIGEGDEKSISVAVSQAGCTASGGVNPEGCKDCSDFSLSLKVTDSTGADVTDTDCLDPGSYTVEVDSPPNNASLEWRDNNTDLPDSDTSIEIELAEGEQHLISLEASSEGCSDVVTHLVQHCPPPPPTEVFLPCILFKIFALIGLGLFFLGAIMTACPTVSAPIIAPPYALALGLGLMAVGAVLFILFITLWILICKPTRCDWFSFLWQALVLLGFVLIYAGFCPTCSWMLAGVIPLILGSYLSIVWARSCDASTCRVLIEWISLMTFVVNVVVVLEFILASCVITSQPIAAGIWGFAIAAIQVFLWQRAMNRGCVSNA